MVAPVRFLSGRQQQQKIGVEGSTENKKVLEVIGRVGIGSTIFEPNVTLDVRGDTNISGSLTIGSTTGGAGLSAESLTISGLSSTKDLYVSGFSTFKNVVDIDSNTYISGKLGIGTDVVPTGKFEVAGGESNFRGDVNIYNDLFVAGNVSVAGSSVTLDTETVRVEDKDIVLGFTTTITPNDITANHGGIAIASTEGYPLVPLYAVGINTLPDTYKQFMWVKSGTYAGMTTDAWVSNYAISIGNTSIEEGVTLKVGTGTSEIRMYGNTGIISAYRYFGSGGFLDDIIKEKLEGITAVLVDSVGTATTLGTERRVADLFIDNSNASVGYITAVGFGSTARYYFNDVTAIGLTTDANVNTSGIITAFGFNSNGGTFTGDGSGLTGLAGVAAGVTVSNNDTDVGTASRLNFGPDIDVSAISAGIVTMSLNANQNFTGIVTVSTLDVTNLEADNAIIGLATVTELTGISTLGIGTFEIKSSPSDNESLIFEASAGDILTLTNSLTEGSLFSISDEFGVPTFDSNANGTVSIVPYNVGHYLGVGKTNPQAKLDVSGDALVSGNIGIGTTNPQAKLDVIGDTLISGDVGIGTTNPQAQFHILAQPSNTSNTSFLRFYEQGNAVGLNTTYNSTSGGVLALSGYYHDNIPGRELAFFVDNSGHAKIQTSDNFPLFIGTDQIDAISINGNSQRVGINTKIAERTLDINGDIRVRGALYDFNNVTGNPGELLSTTGAGVSWTTSTTTPSGRSVTSISTSTSYYITASETTLGVSTAAYIDSNIVIKDGNIGVGTTSPQYKLDVNGSLNVSGASELDDLNVSGVSTFVGDISIADKIIHTGDTDTAIRFPANDTFTVETAGSEKLRIASNGRIGVNNPSPNSTLDIADTSAELRITSTGQDRTTLTNTGSGFEILQTGSKNIIFHTNANERLRITSDGLVGIGTDNPQAKLDVIQTEQREDGLRVYNANFDAGSGFTPGEVHLIGDYDGNGMDLISAKLNGVTKFVVDGDNGGVGVGTDIPKGLFEIFDLGYDRGTTGGEASVSFIKYRDDNFLEYLVDWRIDDASIFIIEPTGNVGEANIGIGITNPTAKLDVNGSLIVSDDVSIGAGGTTAFFDVSTGNIGIGTTSPQYKLHVVGDFGATTKSFVIPHPTKPGMTLRHGSLEGPENGVYVRGKTTESIITLPDYWIGLVDEDTITVNLTPKNGKLHSVVGVSSNTVEIECVDDEVNCYFMILGERKDVAKLVVEY